MKKIRSRFENHMKIHMCGYCIKNIHEPLCEKSHVAYTLSQQKRFIEVKKMEEN